MLGPDGKPVPDTGFLGLEGRAALDARADALKALKERREQGRTNLKSPLEQLEFDNQTRRLYADAESMMGRHAESQWKTWATGVNKKGATLSLNEFTNNLENPKLMADHARDYINYKVQEAQIKYGDDPTARQAAVTQAKSDLLQAQVDAIAIKDAPRAMRILEKNKDVAGAKYDEMYKKIEHRADTQAGDQAAARALSGPRAGAFSQPVHDAITAASQATGVDDAMLRRFAMIESGGKPDAVKGSYRGLFQMSQAEFQKYGPDGGNIFDPKDNALAAANKIKAETAQFQQKYGRPATPADLYLIHQQGQAGYAAHMANPDGKAWENMLSTAEGQQKGALWAKQAIWGNVPDQMKVQFGNVDNISSRDFVGLWAAKVNNGQMLVMDATKAAQKSAAYKVAMDDPQLVDNPRAMQHALSVINQRLTALNIADEQTDKLRKEKNDLVADGYVKKILAGGDLNGIREEILNDPNLTDWRIREHLITALQHKSGNDVEQATATYGQGYWDVYKRVLAGPNDPSRVSDLGEILRMAGPDIDPSKRITMAGVDRLGHVMQQNMKSVDAHSVNTSKVGLIGYAKSKLSFDQETIAPGFPGLRDKKGEQIFQSVFIPKFEAAYDAWVKAGKSPWEFLTKENVDKMILGMRNPAQMRMERMAAMGENAPDSKTPLPEAPEGVDKAGWKTVMAGRPTGANGKVWPYDSWAAAVNALRSDPSPEAVKEFDEAIGKKTGVAAKTILDALNPPKGEKKEPTSSEPGFLTRWYERERQKQRAYDSRFAEPP